MGLFKKRPPPTAPDSTNGEQRATGDTDVEKNYETVNLENAPVDGGIGHHHIDPDLEKRVVRKLDWNVVSLVTFLYLLSFLDRSNIGNAKIAGMTPDLKLVGDRYDWLLTIFYIAYILGEFQAFMWKILPKNWWASFVVFAWGIIATAQTGVANWHGEMALRFLMGLFEAGFGPGVPYLLSFFYLRHEIGSRIGIFLAAAPLANTFAGALAYGITSGHPSIAKWRLLFLVEGLPTVVMAVVTFFVMPDGPTNAWFLNEDEKRIAKARGVRQVGQEEKRTGGLDWKSLGVGVLDAKNWFTANKIRRLKLLCTAILISYAVGFGSINAQGLTAPPYFLSFLVTMATAWVADRTKQRGLMIMALSTIGGIGYIILATTTGVGPRYFGVFLAASGVFPSIANILPWVLNNQGDDTRRGLGIVILNLVGQCGPLLGTRIFPESDQPRYIKGQSICAAFMFFTTLLAFGLRFLLVWENKKLDKKYGTLVEQDQRAAVGDHASSEKAAAEVAEENYGPRFRYIL
ncbi:MAG: hypothetical protein M1820_007791 [Bogoriella megaspora]|nr:MAG: hypothetical protein M1820_007791 [Bogoriella megaspora]